MEKNPYHAIVLDRHQRTRRAQRKACPSLRHPGAFDLNRCSTVSSLASNSLRASVSAVRPSARSFVVGFSVDRETSRNLLPAVEAHGAALLMVGNVSTATDRPAQQPNHRS